jgi:dihydropteroate synthase
VPTQSDLWILAPTAQHLREVYGWDQLSPPGVPESEFPVVVRRGAEAHGWDRFPVVSVPGQQTSLYLCPRHDLPSTDREAAERRLSTEPPERLRIGQAVLQASPAVMGILNVTPDSFSDGGLYSDPERAVARGLEMFAEGAAIVDIGGESTRPGSRGVTAEEEKERVLPVLRSLRRQTKAPLSVDTRKSAVAAEAIDAGADMINDVSGFRDDPLMAPLLARHQRSAIAMHMRGRPDTMQSNTRYRHLLADVAASLEESRDLWERAGGAPDGLFIDPGIGFGKDAQGNRLLLRYLGALRSVSTQIAAGASRKSFILKTLGLPADAPAEQRLAGSLACTGAAVGSGAAIVRVHDVGQTVRYLAIQEALERPEPAALEAASR